MICCGAWRPTLSEPVIALDALGLDRGPEEAVEAAAAMSLVGGIHVVLVGPSDALGAYLSERRYDPAWVTIRHAADAVEMHERPREALERKPNATIAVAMRMLADGEAHGLVTAGHTGGAIVAASTHLTLIPGIKRAALATVFPSQRRHGLNNDPFTLALDVGATVEADAETLHSFAHMGAAYCRIISKTDAPAVALLSNGAEATKGPPNIVAANRLLSADNTLHFVGNIEGLDIPTGRANVVVTDGFTGNIVLKLFEGMGDTLRQAAKYAARNKMAWRAGMALLSGGIKQIREVTDWREYGGAPLLGFSHLIIKAHGRSGARALGNAIKVAAKSHRDGLVPRISEAMNR